MSRLRDGRRRPRRPFRIGRAGAYVLLALGFSAGAWAAAILIAQGRAADMKTLRRVNYEVNTIDRRSAPLSPGGDPDGVFDCEDYARTKMARLAAAGVSASEMSLRVVRHVGWRTAHMVLVVDGWVLDNMNWAITPLQDARRYYSGWEDPDAVVVIPQN